MTLPLPLARCADCGRRPSDYVPIDAYRPDPESSRLRLCLGCLAFRRMRGEEWRRIG